MGAPAATAAAVTAGAAVAATAAAPAATGAAQPPEAVRVATSGSREWGAAASKGAPALSAALRVAALVNPARFEAPRAAAARSRAGSASTAAVSEGANTTAAATAATAAAHGALDVEAGDGDERVAVGGNGMDKALLAWAATFSDVDAAPRGHAQLVDLPFSSATKLAAGVFEERATGAGAASAADVRVDGPRRFVAVKGAPEFVLERCPSAAGAGGGAVELTPTLRAAIVAAIDALAREGQRVVGLADRDLPPTADMPHGFDFTAEPDPNFPTDGLTFIGAASVTDPPRPGVGDAIRTMRAAGIKVAMVTGDAAVTAAAIAADVGIISAADGDTGAPLPAPDTLASGGFGGGGGGGGGRRAPPAPGAQLPLAELAAGGGGSKVAAPRPAAAAAAAAAAAVNVAGAAPSAPAAPPRASAAIVVSGPELVALPPAGWDFIFRHDELVFARTTPEQKLQIVRECKARGHRVGVTGDGVNDAPALKAADVGIAMNGGSDVSRDAAAIVLLKDDFATVADAVREGRLIFTNLRKVVAYLLSAGSWSELLPALACFWLGMPQPLSSFLMIVICCVTDVFAGIALMYEPAEGDIMRVLPRDVKRDRLVTLPLLAYAYLFYGTLESLAAFVTWFVYMYTRGPVGLIATPLPPADPGNVTYPVGYTPSQLTFAWNWGADSGALGADEAAALATSSSVFFLVLVVAQTGHLLSVRKRIPYFSGLATAGTWREAADAVRADVGVRWPIVAAWAGSVVVVNVFNEIPALQLVCGTAHLPPAYWGVAIGWSAAIFAAAEARKWALYLHPDGAVARACAW